MPIAAYLAAIPLVAPAAAPAPLTPAAVARPATPASSQVSKQPLGVSVRRPFRAGHARLALTGERFAVDGRAGRPAHGRRVTVSLLRAERVVSTHRVRIDGAGRFTTTFLTRNPGAFAVRAFLPAGPGRLARRGQTRVGVYQSALHAGLRGPLVRWVQGRLHALGYLRQSPTGRWTVDTGLSVLAYRDANGIRGLDRPTHTNLHVLRALRSPRPGFVARYPGQGHHVEADISKQVLGLFEGGRIVQLMHMSSGRRGKPTILGSFRFYRKDPGRNKTGMYNSNYFVGGYAVHGYNFVPEFPDSHGCLRIPMTDADFVFGWIRIGDRIDLYP